MISGPTRSIVSAAARISWPTRPSPLTSRLSAAARLVARTSQMENPSASFRFRDEGGVERHLAVAPTFRFNKMVRGRSTPVVFGGHFHVTRFGMFRSRAGLALNPWSTAAGSRLAYRHRPYLHTQDVIRTAPPSRSRVKNDYSILGMLSRNFSRCILIRHARARPAHLPLARDGRVKHGHDVFVVRHARARPAHLPLARDGRIDPQIKSGD